MMDGGSLLRSGGETSEPASPDYVQETGVSLGGRSGFLVVAAEPSKSSNSKKRPGHGPDPSFCALQGLGLLEISTAHPGKQHRQVDNRGLLVRSDLHPVD
jgi:hypothetical protein